MIFSLLKACFDPSAFVTKIFKVFVPACFFWVYMFRFMCVLSKYASDCVCWFVFCVN